VKGASDAFVKGIHAVVLLQADTWLGLNDRPKLKDVGCWESLDTRHLLDIGFKFADIFMNGFGVNNISLRDDLSVGYSREGDWRQGY
jgi:hypothetical protein